MTHTSPRKALVGGMVIVVLAALLGGYHLSRTSPMLLVWVVGFFVLSLIVELVLNRVAGRSVRSRSDADAER